MASDDEDGTDITSILMEIGMHEYVKVFQENMIRIQDAVDLSDEDFNALGLQAIGLRLRLKQACRNHLQGRNEDVSPVMKKFFELKKERHRILKSKKVLTKHFKPTRRVYCGWKHAVSLDPEVFKLVTVSKGGGQQIIDVSKDTTYDELESLVIDLYFPKGRSIAQNLKLTDLNYYIASFSGEQLPKLLDIGGFTVGKFFEHVKTYPVRVYLHTSKKVDNPDDKYLPDIHVNPQSTCESTEGEKNEKSSNDISDAGFTHSGSSDEFESGTPTVVFPKLRRCRNLLRLNRSSRPTEMSENPSTPLPEVSSEPVASSSSASPSEPLYSSSPTAESGTVSSASPEYSSEQKQSTSSAAIPEENPSTPSEPLYSSSPTAESGTVSSATPEYSSEQKQSTSSAAIPEENPSTSTTDPIIVIHDPMDEYADEVYDHDLLAVIQQSLEDTEPQPTMDGILKWWMKKTLITDGFPTEIVVQRQKLLQSTMRVVSRVNFSFKHPFHVRFSGEIGDDQGGPKREYFRELMKEVNNTILEGPENCNKVFKHSVDLLHKKMYELCGSLVAWSLLHGGPGLPVLNRQLYDLMHGKEIQHMDTNCIADFDTKSCLLEIEKASTNDEFENAVSRNSDWLLSQGLAPHSLKIDRKDELLNILFKNEIYYRVHSEISQFIEGMDQVGEFSQAIHKAPDALRTLFVLESHPLTFGELRKLYVIDFSPDGSNNRCKEDSVIYCFEAFCADCEAGILEVSLSDILVFWSGASQVPPLGFDQQLKISFIDSEQCRLPVAHTCSLGMELWRGYSDPDDFRDDMIKAIQWGGGFHLA